MKCQGQGCRFKPPLHWNCFYFNFSDCGMRRLMISVNSRGNWHAIINNYGCTVLILLARSDWIFTAYGTQPLTGWFHLLVQDSRWRTTIWTFKLLAALFVIMPAHHAEICDLIQIYLKCTLKGCWPLNKKSLKLSFATYFILWNPYNQKIATITGDIFNFSSLLKMLRTVHELRTWEI